MSSHHHSRHGVGHAQGHHQQFQQQQQQVPGAAAGGRRAHHVNSQQQQQQPVLQPNLLVPHQQSVASVNHHQQQQGGGRAVVGAAGGYHLPPAPASVHSDTASVGSAASFASSGYAGSAGGAPSGNGSSTAAVAASASASAAAASAQRHHTSSSQLTPQERDRYIEKFDFKFCAKVDKYEKMTKIGQGTFGEVFKAKLRTDKTKIVALKKVLMDNEKEGFPITALREIRILQLLNHENIVNLIEICRQYRQNKTTFYLVFDFCEHDLAGLLSNVNVKFSLGEIKKVMQQMFEGLFYIHSNKIIHRDMKAANILITKQGILKLADFGLARAISINKSQPNRYTNRVVTLWYRPPELLLGERNYGPPVDLWGAGCIMAEMWTRSPIMQGNTEQHQLTMIAQLCGAITPEVWPGVEKLELFNKVDLPKTSKRRVKERLKPYVKDAYACDLIDKLLSLDPAKRTDADSALNHDFFWMDPMPCSLERMLSNHVQSMFEYLAPRRGGAHVAQPQPQPTRNANNDGYKDMVY